MAFSIRLSDEEKEIAYAYSQLHSMSLGEAFKTALFEKIEEEYDVEVANVATQEYIDSGRKSRPIAELEKELGLYCIASRQLRDSTRNSRSWTHTSRSCCLRG